MRGSAPALTSLLASVLVWGTLAACDASTACTEIGCESEAVVTFDGSISEVYILIIEYGSQSVEVRCNDAGSLESEGNPEWVTCDTGGFEFTGEAADERDILVSITLEDAEQTPVFSRQLVDLTVTEDGIIEPNGPDCPPVCFERRGSMLLPDSTPG